MKKNSPRNYFQTNKNITLNTSPNTPNRTNHKDFTSAVA